MTQIPEYVRPPTLPDFENPPVSEVVLAVRFAPLEVGAILLAVVGHEVFGSELPRTEEHPPVVMPIEEFGGGGRDRDLDEILETPPSPRFWFISESGNEVAQVQEDFFARNWRREDASGVIYPHFDAVREPFIEGYLAFSDALGEQTGKALTPIQCEVTYVNHLLPGPTWSAHREFAKVLGWPAPRQTSFLPEAESARVVMKYVIQQSGEPIGRLQASSQPAFRRIDQLPVIIFNLTARGRPLSDDLGGVVRFMDIGHEWIVRGFKELTTPAMHREWGLKDGE